MTITFFPGGYESRTEGPFHTVIADAGAVSENEIGRICPRFDAASQRHLAEASFMGKGLGLFSSVEAGAMAVIAAYEALGGCHGIEREAEFDTPSAFGVQCAQVLRGDAIDEIAGHLESAVRHSGERLQPGEAAVMLRTARGLRELLRMADEAPSAKPADAARGDFDARERWTKADERLYQKLFG